MVNIFIIGSKGIPAKYGGFETFVENLTKKKKNESISYHVSCLSDRRNEFYYNNSRCFNVKVPKIGSAKAVLYDMLSLNECIKYIKENNLKNCIVYILACRIGLLFGIYKKKLEKLGVRVYVNPDGHEWKRSKWNYLVRRYWKLSERLMIKHADLIICDSKGIESYIHEQYGSYNPKTTYIAYGADLKKSLIKDSDEVIIEWFNKYKIKEKEYYLIVGRFVPENNYELIITEFMNSKTEKDLVIISNIENNSFYDKLLQSTNFKSDERIKFVGTLYDQELLRKIREQAYGYIHGHEVGGTNPSLLEALASTDLNILLDVIFNKEVGKDGAVYFNKDKNNLSHLINKLEDTRYENIKQIGKKARKRISDDYSWDKIVSLYENLFLKPM